MIHCENCNNQIEATSKYCGYCGVEMKSAVKPSNEEPYSNNTKIEVNTPLGNANQWKKKDLFRSE